MQMVGLPALRIQLYLYHNQHLFCCNTHIHNRSTGGFAESVCFVDFLTELNYKILNNNEMSVPDRLVLQ